MTNPQFGFDELAASQSQPHVPINNADRTLSAALAGELQIEFASDADYELGEDEWAYGVIRAIDTSPPVLTTGRSVIYPDVDSIDGVQSSRMRFVFINDTAQTLTIKRSGGTGVAVPAGESAHVWHDGTDIEEVSTAGGGGGGSGDDGHGTLTTLSIVSNTISIDHSAGSSFDLELTANVGTVNHSNLVSGKANWFTLRVRQDNVGGRTLTPPASWIYPSGVGAYVPTSTADAVDLIQGVTYDDGVTWLIDYAQDYV